MKRRARSAKIGALSLVGLMVISLLGGCGSSAAAGEASSNNKDATVVKVGVGQVRPFDYQDEDGNFQGYEVEILKALDAELPQYSFELQAVDSKNATISLDAGKIDISSDYNSVSDARKEKYNFTEPYTIYLPWKIAVLKESNVSSIEDLAGKKVISHRGTGVSEALEQYNKDHPDKAVEIEYTQASKAQMDEMFKSGTIDAGTLDPVTAANAYPFLKVVGDPLYESQVGFLLRKDSTQLKTDLDGALKKLEESGKLAQLSKDILGDDYTKPLS